MKRNLKWAVIVLVIIFVGMQLIPISRANPPVTREVKWDSPQTQALAQRACNDCHSNQTTWPWDSYIAPVSFLIANHILFAEQAGENVGAFRVDNLKRFAADLKLNTQQFNQCLDSGQYRDKVQQEVIEGQRQGVISTPTLFVNGQLIQHGSDYQVLQTAIESALAGN